MRIEAAFRRRETLDPPGMDGFGDSLQLMRTAILIFEGAACQQPSAVAYHHLAWLGEGL